MRSIVAEFEDKVENVKQRILQWDSAAEKTKTWLAQSVGMGRTVRAGLRTGVQSSAANLCRTASARRTGRQV